MNSARQAEDILDRDFLAIRHEILNIAAALDRIDSGRSTTAVGDDPRMVQIREALSILTGTGHDKAKRIQLAFSREYDPNWRS